MRENKEKGRRTRFQARIATEREILGILNSSDLCRSLPLAGMTAHAIADWESRAQDELDQSIVAQITQQLYEIGRKTELLADDSRDVFNPNELIHQKDVEHAKTCLLQMVSK